MYKDVEKMLLREMGPQLKLHINIMQGSMPLQCNTYFFKFLPFKVLCRLDPFTTVSRVGGKGSDIIYNKDEANLEIASL